MLVKFFLRVKIIVLVCLFISVALPTVSHALEMTSEVHCDKTINSNDHGVSKVVSDSQISQVELSDQDDKLGDVGDLDHCNSCHSGCCAIKTLPRLGYVSPDFNMEILAFSHVSEFVAGTGGSSLFRPPKFFV